MSPEQVEGKALDPRTDIYSFGVTCYYMLSGEPPFRGGTAFELALQHVQKAPPPLKELRPDLPKGLCAVVHKMLAKDRELRYQNGRDLMRDIVRLRDEMSGTTVLRQSSATEPVEFPAVLPVEAPVKPRRTEPRAEPHEEPHEELPGPAGRQQHGLALAVAALSVLLLAVGGVVVAFAWRGGEPQARLPAPDGKPAEPGGVPALPLAVAKTRVQVLREAADQALNVGPGRAPEAGGAEVCAELGLLYLDAGRLDEADALFTRMDAVPQPRPYHQLGRLGRGVVLALRNQARESNQLFKDVLAPFPGLLGPPPPPKIRFPIGKRPSKDGGTSKQMRQLNEALQPVRPVLDQEGWQRQFGQARWANRKNGVSDDQVPTYLVSRFPARGGPGRPGKR
jgi:serine/threonine-protein kinase